MLEPDLLNNKLLSALPREDLDLLQDNVSVVSFDIGTVLCETGDEVDNVYFPLDGVISLATVLKDGKTIETATVGSEGVFGAMCGFGLRISHVRATVQLPLRAARISAPMLRKIVPKSPNVSNLCIHYNEVLLNQARISSACNALHEIEARFCRWLLQTSDREGWNKVLLTQAFLSKILGVRRTSVSEVATKLQRAGIITYSRGSIRIIDRKRLYSMSCECYETSRQRGLT